MSKDVADLPEPDDDDDERAAPADPMDARGDAREEGANQEEDEATRGAGDMGGRDKWLVGSKIFDVAIAEALVEEEHRRAEKAKENAGPQTLKRGTKRAQAARCRQAPFGQEPGTGITKGGC